MAAPIRFLSGRQQQQKIGIEGSTEDKKVLEVVGRTGIGTTSFEPAKILDVRGDAIVEGTATVGKLEITGTGDVPASLTVETANVTGVSTFGGAIDVNAGLDVDGQADLDEVVVAGVATFSSAVDINSTLDVDGDTQLDDLTVAGVATFSSAINATDIIKGYEYTAAPSGSTVTLAVTVASKDATHRYNGTGSGNGYVIDGIQAPFLTLTPGRTYRFTNDNTGSHPFRFYLEADRSTLYSSGVNFQDTYTEITISDTTPEILHYQCSSHAYMGNAVQTNSNTVVVSTASTFSSAVDINSTLDVDGDTQLDDLTVAGVATFQGAVNFDVNSEVNIGTGVTILGDNLHVTGIVSALQFIGDGSGITNLPGISTQGSSNLTDVNVSGTTTTSQFRVSGIGTAERFIVSTGGLDVDGQTDLDELIVSGVSTFQGNIVAATAEFSGNVTIGGTLIVEDKTNVDSIGLVTARTGVRVLAGGIDVTAGISTFGALVDVNNRLDVVGGANIDQVNATGISSFTELDVSTGGLDVDGQTDLDELQVAGVSTFSAKAVFNTAYPSIDADNEIQVGTAIQLGKAGVITATSFSGDGSNLTGVGTQGSRVDAQSLTVSGISTFNDDVRITAGGLNVTGVVTATTFSGSGASLTAVDAATLDGVDSTSFLRSDAADVKTSGNLRFNDSVSATFGDSDDLNIQHNGVHSYISNYTGGLILDQHVDNGSISLRSDNGSGGVIEYIECVGSSGEVRLRYYGSEKFVTNTGGITVTGGVNATGVVTATSFSGSDVSVTGDIGAAGIITATGMVLVAGSGLDVGAVGVLTALSLDISTGGIDVDGQSNLDEVAIAGVTTFSALADVNNRLDVVGGANIDQVNVTGIASFAQLDVSTGGIDVDGLTNLDELIVAGVSTFTGTVNIDGALDIGVAGVDVEGLTNLDELIVAGVSTFQTHVHLGDSDELRFGAGDDLKIYHNGSTSLIDNTTVGSIAIRQLVDDADVVLQSDDGSGGVADYIRCDGSEGEVRLYHYGNEKLNTKTDGVTVSGELSSDSLNCGTGGLDVDGQTDLDELVVAGVSTFSAKAVFNTAYPSIDADNEIQVGTAIQLGKAGVITATSFSGDGSALTGIAATDHVSTFDLVVAGVSTFVGFATFRDGLHVTGVSTFANAEFNNVTTDFNLTVEGSSSLNGNVTFGNHTSDTINFNGRVDTGITPREDDKYDLGSSSLKWKDLYLDGTANIDGLNVTGVSTLSTAYPSIDADNEIQVGTAIQLGKAGVITATSFVGSGALLTGIVGGQWQKTDVGINTVDKVGVGTTSPQAFLEIHVGTAVTAVDVRGSEGQLFSVTNNLTDGSIFSVNDVSGIPSIDVDADGTIQIAPYGAGELVGIGTTNPTSKLDIVGDVQVVGVVTATSFSGDGSSLTGIAATDHVSTFDLVVAGISTFNNDVNFVGDSANIFFDKSQNRLEFADTAAAIFGTGDDLQIYHNTHSYIDHVGSNNLHIRNTTNDQDVTIQTDDGSGNLATYFQAEGASGRASMHFYGARKLYTNTGGVDVTGGVNATGVVTATSFSGDGSALTGIGTQGPDGSFRGLTVAGISTFNDRVFVNDGGINVSGISTINDELFVRHSASTFSPHLTLFAENTFGALIASKVGSGYTHLEFRGESGGGGSVNMFYGVTGEHAGSLNMGGIKLEDNKGILFGTDKDAYIRYDPTPGLLDFTSVHTEPIVFSTNETERARITGDGVVAVSGIVTATGINVVAGSGLHAGNTGVVTAAQLSVGDNQYITAGVGTDLVIYHDGSNSYISEGGTGNLIIKADDFKIRNSSDKNFFNMDGNTVKLFHTGLERVTTTLDGVDIGGTGSIKVPVGTTAQRNSSPTAGDFRYNSDEGAFEGYTDSWGSIGGSGGAEEVDTNVSSTSAVGVGSFATASFRSAEVIAQIVQIDEYQVGKYLMIHDGTTVTVIEQAAVATGDSMLGSFDGAINGSNAELRVNMVTSGIATVTTKISTVTI